MLFYSGFSGANWRLSRGCGEETVNQERMEKWMERRVVAAGGKRNLKVRLKGERGRGSLALSSNLIPVGVATARAPVIVAFKGLRCHVRWSNPAW